MEHELDVDEDVVVDVDAGGDDVFGGGEGHGFGRV